MNRSPVVFEHEGVWHAVQWPDRGRGSTPEAALVDLALRRLLLVLIPAR